MYDLGMYIYITENILYINRNVKKVFMGHEREDLYATPAQSHRDRNFIQSCTIKR